MTRNKQVKRAVENGEPTALERATLKKIKKLKSELRQVTAERDMLIGALMSAGLPRSTVDLLMESSHADT